MTTALWNHISLNSKYFLLLKLDLKEPKEFKLQNLLYPCIDAFSPASSTPFPLFCFTWTRARGAGASACSATVPRARWALALLTADAGDRVDVWSAGLGAQPVLAGGTAGAGGLGAGGQGSVQPLFAGGTHVATRRVAADEKDGGNPSCRAPIAASEHQTLP